MLTRLKRYFLMRISNLSMDEQRLQAYLNLIQSLLSCPSGEELGLLRSHEKLIDSDFIEVLKKVANQMEIDGETDTAEYLQSLAEQLNQAFAQAENIVNSNRQNRTEAYVKIIEALLNATDEEEADEILNGNLELIDGGFVQTMTQVANLLAEKGDENAGDFLMSVANQLSKELELS